jgi:alkylation response protein AidB-like acyl-CoA dehydrogenase
MSYAAGVRLTYDDDLEEFRAEYSAWLTMHRPSRAEILANRPRSSGDLPDWARRWIRCQFDHGWLKPRWPPELGGRNATPEQEVVYLEELFEQRVQRTPNIQGLDITAPSLRDFGTDEQVDRYLHPLLRGEKAACLGMSEPGAGSDLASLSTRAIFDDGAFVVNGQKVWTSGANEADFALCFVRTDPAAPKHRGISALLIDLDSPGVTIRPLVQATGRDDLDFNEVFFDDVIVPAENLLGPLNGGWQVANSSLGHERMMLWLNDASQCRRKVAQFVDVASTTERDGRLLADDPVVRDLIARAHIDAEAISYIGYRGVAKFGRGGEANAPQLTLLKLYASEVGQDIEQTVLELLGPAGLVDRRQPGEVAVPGVDDEEQPPFVRFLTTYASTIAGGTSEIQRNIIAERVLGLPRS